jgi:DNA polymerase V
VFFHTNGFKTGAGQYQGAWRMALHPITAGSLELLAAARRGVEAAWRDGYAYTKAGIMLDDLIAAELRPRTLFEGDTDRRDRLMTALDEVNGKFGKFTAVPAAQGFRRDWKMRAENRSPAWTTRIDEVPLVRAD